MIPLTNNKLTPSPNSSTPSYIRDLSNNQLKNNLIIKLKHLNKNDNIEYITNNIYKTYYRFFNYKENNNPKISFMISNSFNNDVEYYTNNGIASLYIRYLTNTYNNLEFCDLDNIKVFNFAIFNTDGVYNVVRTAGQDVGGVRRDFINALCKEFFIKNILIKKDNIYYLNPNYLPDDEFLELLKIKTLKFEYKSFYIFLGKLLSFILVNKCGLNEHLSYGLLSLFKYDITELKDDDYLFYLLLDAPFITKNRLYYLSDDVDNDIIKDEQLTYNDNLYNLVSLINNKDKLKISLVSNRPILTKENYEIYLKLLSKQLISYSILTKDDIIITDINNNKDKNKEKRRNSLNDLVSKPKPKPKSVVNKIISPNVPKDKEVRYLSLCTKGFKLYNYINEGIPKDIKNYIRDKDLSLKSIDKLLSSNILNISIIKLLIDNINKYNNNTPISKRFIDDVIVYNGDVNNKKDLQKHL